MLRLASGALVFLGAVLLVLAVRTLDRLQRLAVKLDALEARVKAPPPRPAAPPPEVVVVPAPSTSPADPAPSRPEAVVTRDTSAFELGETGAGAPRTSNDRVEVGLTPEQTRAIEGVQEARRRERLQIDAETRFRLRELERRYDDQIRSWLDAEQRRRFDESRPAPRLDGPLTAAAQDYIRRDPAPYDLEVEWGEEWWPAHTKDVRGGLTLIHYVGHGEEWHEWVGPERVRPRR